MPDEMPEYSLEFILFNPHVKCTRDCVLLFISQATRNLLHTKQLNKEVAYHTPGVTWPLPYLISTRTDGRDIRVRGLQAVLLVMQGRATQRVPNSHKCPHCDGPSLQHSDRHSLNETFPDKMRSPSMCVFPSG